jgi:hypothetical protein
MTKQLNITKTQNGYIATHENECQREQIFTFENPRRLFDHILHVLDAAILPKCINDVEVSMFGERCKPMSTEDMRDELGRLRAETKRASVANSELQSRIASTTDTLNKVENRNYELSLQVEALLMALSNAEAKLAKPRKR